ncbi:hypothetical protein ACO0LD_20765 [Undibacterium sp. Ji83W]|uniref:hypothetical protein n=1 Tax=Undibacterium sp. Ji83W TaxID=3413043 RepID=UPI003BF3FB78
MVVRQAIAETREYQEISKVYGDRRAGRSQELLIKHIDDGLQIMIRLNASLDALKAFCIHPLFQADQELAVYAPMASAFQAEVMMLVMEYRRAANAYLCKPHTDAWDMADLALYVGWILPEVRKMLMADKLQNQVDFLMHHADTHQRRAELKRYFELWIKYLNEMK